MKIKQMLKTVAIFFIGNALTKVIAFFMLPLYTNTSLIPQAHYGNYEFVFSLINLVVPIAFFQIWDGMYRIAFDYKENLDKQKVMSNAVAFSLIGVILYVALFFILKFIFDIYCFELALVYGLIFGLNYLYTISTRVYLSNKLFVFSGLISSVVTAGLNILLLLQFNLGLTSIYISASAGLLIQIIIIELKIGVLRKFRIKHVSGQILRQMIRFSIPLCIATVSYWLLSGFTKVLIDHFLGDAGNGVYGVANKFSVFITFVVTVIQFAWNETAYLISTEDKIERTKSYNVSLNIIVIGVIFCTGLFCLASKIIFPFMVHDDYIEALVIIPVSVVGVGANSLASFLGTFFMAEKKNRCIWVSTLISAGVNVIGGYFFTKYFGLMGAIAVLSVSFLLLAIIRMVVASKAFKLKLKIKPLLLSVAILAVSVVAYYLIASKWIILGVILAILLLVAILYRKKIKEILKLLIKKS